MLQIIGNVLTNVFVFLQNQFLKTIPPGLQETLQEYELFSLSVSQP